MHETNFELSDSGFNDALKNLGQHHARIEKKNFELSNDF